MNSIAIAHINAEETCPVCKKGHLLEGPRALGINVNVKCDNQECRQEFCLTILHGEVVRGEFIARDEPRWYKERVKIKEPPPDEWRRFLR